MQSDGFRTAFFLISLLAGSASVAESQAASSWSKHRITLYGWGSALDGDIRLAPLPRLSVSRSFSETLSSLDFGAMAVYETRAEDWGLLIDLQAVKLSDGGHVPVLGAPGRIETELLGVLAAATYRIHETQSTYLDLLAGLRHWSIDTEARILVPPGMPPPFPTDARDSRSVTVPQLGIKGTWSAHSPWFVTGWAMVGAGGNTDLASDAMVALGYGFSELASLMLGYRRVDLDYSGDRVDLDLSFQGPGVALDFRFR